MNELAPLLSSAPQFPDLVAATDVSCILLEQ
jgi:hypothetical protein